MSIDRENLLMLWRATEANKVLRDSINWPVFNKYAEEAGLVYVEGRGWLSPAWEVLMKPLYDPSVPRLGHYVVKTTNDRTVTVLPAATLTGGENPIELWLTGDRALCATLTPALARNIAHGLIVCAEKALYPEAK